MIFALKAVIGGGTYFSTMAPTILRKHMEELETTSMREDYFDSLSRREKEVFQHLNSGESLKDIANDLFINQRLSNPINIISWKNFKLHPSSISPKRYQEKPDKGIGIFLINKHRSQTTSFSIPCYSIKQDIVALQRQQYFVIIESLFFLN